MAIRNRRTRNADGYASPTCPPGWAWLLAGILIGVFISFLVYLREIAPQSLPTDNVQTTVPAPSPQRDTSVATDFQFYDLLPDQQKMPGTGATSPPLQQGTPADLPITTPGRYLLQVGSFRNEQEAEGLKSYLISLGIQASIEKTNLNETGRWYRVQVGPLTDLNQLNQTRALLAKNNIHAILRKF
jgi:cell division protein FtsN